MRVVFRADGGSAMGIGHVMRCYALAQSLATHGGACVFAVHTDSMPIAGNLRGMTIFPIEGAMGSAADAAETAAIARAQGCEWVVVDGLQFDGAYQRALRDAGLRVLAVDDRGHAGHYSADIVLNQNLSADESMYASRDAHTRLLLGPEYVLLRPEFLKWREWKREIPERAERVLITMGGADPPNATAKAIRAVQLLDDASLYVEVVVGPANPHGDEIAALAKANCSITIARDVKDMAARIAAADVVVASGGSTLWELAVLGAPALVGRIAEVEDAPVSAACERGLFRDLGWYRDVSVDKIAAAWRDAIADHAWREGASRLGRATVDGRGCERVLAAMDAA